MKRDELKLALAAAVTEEYLRWWQVERELGGLDPATRIKVDALFTQMLRLNNELGLAPFEGLPRPERFMELLTPR